MLLALYNALRARITPAVDPCVDDVEGPQVDRDALFDLVGNDTGLLRAVAEAYSESREDQINALEDAVQAGVEARIHHAAHQLSGCLRSLCAGPAAELAREIEHEAQQGLTSDLSARVKDLSWRMVVIEAELAAMTVSALPTTDQANTQLEFRNAS